MLIKNQILQLVQMLLQMDLKEFVLKAKKEVPHYQIVAQVTVKVQLLH